jgi:tRNA dimethylallyltransferase
MNNKKLLVILGPTGSGKSALGMKLAEKYSGEIIAADSRTVYRYIDIGTAKPNQAEMLYIPHHLVDIRNPNELFSAAEFQRLATDAIEKISDQGHLPVMVGGTGLYIDSILFDYQFPAEVNQEARSVNQDKSLDDLVAMLRELDPDAAETVDLKNPRRVMRAIELAGRPRAKAATMCSDTLVLGLALSKESIQSRIEQRVQKMLNEGLIDEVRRVGEQFGWEAEALQAPAYKAFHGVIQGTKTVEEAAADFARADVQLAKRQMTWFKRNPEITWLDAEDPERLFAEADLLTASFLRNP